MLYQVVFDCKSRNNVVAYDNSMSQVENKIKTDDGN
jgi:hypothetical protein